MDKDEYKDKGLRAPKHVRENHTLERVAFQHFYRFYVNKSSFANGIPAFL